MKTNIIGWAHTKFGKHEDRDVESLISEVVRGAIENSGLDPADIDEIVVGQFNSGLDPQSFPSSLPLQDVPELRFKPSSRVENACATGSTAIFHGVRAIESGQARTVLVVGVEKMTGLPTAEVGKALLSASYLKTESDVQGGFAGIFARIADAYFQRYGDQSEAMARIAAKNHKNGSNNPLAQVQKDLGFDFCNTVSDKNPLVVGSLRRTDCSMISDGAAALVLASDDVAASVGKAIKFRSSVLISDFLPMASRDIIRFEGARRSWAQAMETAGIDLGQLDFVETHDCFTIAELIEYEVLGLTEEGKGATAINEGWTQMGGKLPVNPSGGLKAKGHPIGATGVSMHVLSSMQLMGEADKIQVPGAELAGIFNMGGSAVSNYSAVLERRK